MRQGKFPLYLLIAVPFTLQVLGIVSTVGYLSYRSGQQTVQDLTDQLLLKTENQVVQELDHYLSLPHEINQFNIRMVESGVVDLENLDELHNYLITEHQKFRQITSILFGSSEGEFLFVHNTNPSRVNSAKASWTKMGRFNPDNPSRVNLYALNQEGRIGQYLKTLKNADVRERPWYRRAVKTQTSGWSDLFQIGISNLLAINAYAPFYSASQELKGVFSINLSLEVLSEFLANLTLSNTGEVFIIEQNGLLVANSADEPVYHTSQDDKGKPLEPGNVQFRRIPAQESSNPVIAEATAALAEEFNDLSTIQSPQQMEFAIETDAGKQDPYFLRVFSYQDDYGLNWLIVTVVPKSELAGAIDANVRQTIVLSGVALLASLGFGWWSSRWIVRSLRSLSEASQDMAKGNFQQPLPETKIQELETLRQSFQEMAASLQTAKAFQENYQHRLEQQVKEQTAAVRARETQLQLMIDSIPACIAYTDSSLRYQFVNKTYEQWYHSDKENILGHRLPDVIGEEAYRHVEDSVERVLAGETVTYEAQLPYRGRAGRYIYVTLVPDFDESGTVQGYCALITDITEQKQAEQALQAKETHLKQQLAMIEAAADGIGILEGETYSYLNPAHVAIYGYDDPEELLGQSWRILYPSEEIERLEAEAFPILQRDGAWHGETIGLRKDGSTFPVEVSLTVNEEGCRICICQDITARKEAEQELEATTEELNYFFSTGADLHCIANTDGYFLRLNQAWEQTLGYPLLELEGAQFLDYLHPDDVESTLEAIGNLKDGGDIVEFVNRYRCQDGSYRWIEWRSTLEGNLIYAAARDITARKETEQQLIAARKAAEKAAQLKSEFLAMMSHEIRTPMNGVIGILQVLQNSNLTPKQRSQLDVAYTSANSLLSLINDILDFSKVDAGKLPLETTPFSLREHLENFAQTMALPAQEKGLELVLDLCDVPARIVKGDPARLKQILTNLVSNAIKFTEAGEILIQCQLKTVGDRLRFTGIVQDTGVGIPEDKLSSLFEPFTQADASTTRKYGGTGLGLTIVKKLCHLMDGNVSVKSEVGKGSCFTFDVMLEATSKPPQPQEKLNDLTVLVVAKNQSHRQALARQLQGWGVTAITAEQGKTALSLTDAEASGITFALIDYHLPDQPGIELAQELQKRFDLSKSQIMLMTPMNDSEQCQPSNSTIYCTLTKPILPSALWQAITSSKAEPFSQQQSEALTEEESIASTLPALRILLVEDDQMNQLVFKAMMEPYTLQVDIARHGKEALQRLQTASTDHPYHLVLMDCQMPEMDGYETTRQIRTGVAGEPYQTVPIIAMTAYAMAGDQEKCFTAGMDDYISKPLTKGKVMAVLAKWSENSEMKTSEDAINAQAFQNLLAAITENNSEVIVQLLQGTQEDVQQLVESIIPMLERGDNSDAKKALHSLKGKSLTIGAFSLREVCQQMELILKAGNTPDARLIEALEVESKKLLQAITIKLQAYS